MLVTCKRHVTSWSFTEISRIKFTSYSLQWHVLETEQFCEWGLEVNTEQLSVVYEPKQVSLNSLQL